MNVLQVCLAPVLTDISTSNRTSVVAPRFGPWAVLLTLDRVVKEIRVTSASAKMPTGQSLLAREVTTALGGELEKVVGLVNDERRLGVSRVLKFQARPKVPGRLQTPDDGGPHGYVPISVGIANDVHPVLRPREEDVDPV